MILQDFQTGFEVREEVNAIFSCGVVLQISERASIRSEHPSVASAFMPNDYFLICFRIVLFPSMFPSNQHFTFF